VVETFGCPEFADRLVFYPVCTLGESNQISDQVLKTHWTIHPNSKKQHIVSFCRSVSICIERLIQFSMIPCSARAHRAFCLAIFECIKQVMSSSSDMGTSEAHMAVVDGKTFCDFGSIFIASQFLRWTAGVPARGRHEFF
jgi:hypothetical protein